MQGDGPTYPPTSKAAAAVLLQHLSEEAQKKALRSHNLAQRLKQDGRQAFGELAWDYLEAFREGIEQIAFSPPHE